jgi:hypothetical protein
MPPLVTGWVLNAMRGKVTDALTDTCAIKRTNTSGGGLTTVYSAEPCRVVPEDGTPMIQNTEFARNPTMYWIELRYTVVLEEKDQVVHNGSTYEVTEIFSDNTPMVFRKARMRRLKKGTT